LLESLLKAIGSADTAFHRSRFIPTAAPRWALAPCTLTPRFSRTMRGELIQQLGIKAATGSQKPIKHISTFFKKNLDIPD